MAQAAQYVDEVRGGDDPADAALLRVPQRGGRGALGVGEGAGDGRQFTRQNGSY